LSGLFGDPTFGNASQVNLHAGRHPDASRLWIQAKHIHILLVELCWTARLSRTVPAQIIHTPVVPSLLEGWKYRWIEQASSPANQSLGQADELKKLCRGTEPPACRPIELRQFAIVGEARKTFLILFDELAGQTKSSSDLDRFALGCQHNIRVHGAKFDILHG
jgi:hypothetical protein